MVIFYVGLINNMFVVCKQNTTKAVKFTKVIYMYIQAQNQQTNKYVRA